MFHEKCIIEFVDGIEQKEEEETQQAMKDENDVQDDGLKELDEFCIG